MSPSSAQGMQPTSVAGALLTLKVLYLAFMAGITMFAVVVLVLHFSGSAIGSQGMDDFLALLVGLGALTIVPASAFMLPAMRGRAGVAAADAHSAEDPEAAQLAAITHFTTAMLLRAALVEGWGLFATVCALMTGNPLFLVASAASVLVIAMYFPTRPRFDRFFNDAIEKASKETFQ